jgi:5'-3' exonuclease
MGIPYLVASLIRNHKHIQKGCGNAPLDVDVFAIDFNCFIHHYLKSHNPIGTIVVALHEILTHTVRAKKVYIAFDGLVPYAKMVQQRYRRMRRGEQEGFDKHQISPGTPFMKELASTLRFMFPDVTVSDTLERGEGEHKIFTWLRTLPAKERESICIYGLDADLVLIALAQSHLGNILLLRETEETGFSTIAVSDLERVLPIDKDTYIRMCITCFGNDFMPNLAMFSLREDGYKRAIDYTTREDAADNERKILIQRAKDSDRRILAPDGYAAERRVACQLMDGVVDWAPVCYAFWKTCDWTYHYFTTSEVLDWEWYYPYPEAPLVSILDVNHRFRDFVWDHPEPTMTLEDQLRFILPEASLRKAGLSPATPDELYDEDRESRHIWMRRYAWECDPWVSLPHGQLTEVTEFRLP